MYFLHANLLQNYVQVLFLTFLNSPKMKGEGSPLLPVTVGGKRSSSCCKKSLFCIQSRPARWILLWSFAVLLTYRMLYNLEILGQVSFSSLTLILLNAGNSGELSPPITCSSTLKLTLYIELYVLYSPPIMCLCMYIRTYVPT